MKHNYLILASAALAGCSTMAGNPAERRVDYACSYGPNLAVTYAAGEARVESTDGMVTLRQRASGSGFWYETATHSLRGKGNEITYTVRQMAPKQCRST